MKDCKHTGKKTKVNTGEQEIFLLGQVNKRYLRECLYRYMCLAGRDVCWAFPDKRAPAPCLFLVEHKKFTVETKLYLCNNRCYKERAREHLLHTDKLTERIWLATLWSSFRLDIVWSSLRSGIPVV